MIENKAGENNKTTGEKNANTTFTRRLKPPEMILTPLQKSLLIKHHSQRGNKSPFRAHPH